MDLSSFSAARRRRKKSRLASVAPSRGIEASLDLLCLLSGRNLHKQPLFSVVTRLASSELGLPCEFAMASGSIDENKAEVGHVPVPVPDGSGRSDQGHNSTAQRYAHTQISSGVSNDLMLVYENLTRSKTPQTPTNLPQAKSQPQPQSAPTPPATHRPYTHVAQQHQEIYQSSPQQSFPHAAATVQMVDQPPLSFQIPPPPQYPPSQTAASTAQVFRPSDSQKSGQGQLIQQQPAYSPHQPHYYQTRQHTNLPTNPASHSYSSGAQQETGDSQRSPSEAYDTDENVLDEVTSESGRSERLRRKRRSSDNDSVKSGVDGKSKKKSKAADGRWSKRFTWPEDLHKDFVSAIFDVGLKHSSPSSILEHMPKHEQITTERIKSHLQKYRIHRAKSKKEFLGSYDSSMRAFKTTGLDGVKEIAGGAVGAHLAYTTLNDNSDGGSAMAPPDSSAIEAQAKSGSSPSIQQGSSSTSTSVPSLMPQASAVASAPSPRQPPTDALMLPQLTDAEKRSPIGSAMGYLMGLFFSLKQQLIIQRASEAAAGEARRAGDAAAQAAFNSFNLGGPAAFGMLAGFPDSGQPQHHEHSSSQSGTLLSAPSIRTDLEENNMMKREMQSQMAINNKMRALKQQELDKYKSAIPQTTPNESGVDTNDDASAPSGLFGGGKQPGKLFAQGDKSSGQADSEGGHGQGTGEAAADRSAQQNSGDIAEGGADDFWNTDVVDEHLFEFLMNG